MLDYYFGHQIYTVSMVMFGVVILNLVLALFLPFARKFIGVTIFLFGIVLVLNLARYQYLLAFFGSRAEGTIVEIKAITTSSRNSSSKRNGPAFEYRPRVRFETEDGQQVEFLAIENVRKDDYQLKEVVKVSYMSAHPEYAEIVSWRSLWRSLLFGSLFDGLVCFLGIFIMVKQSRKSSPSPNRT